MKHLRHLFLCFLFCPLSLIGQDITLEISSTPSTCFANGTITITLRGSDVGNLSQINYTVENITTSEEPRPGGPVFENLSSGNYSVVMQAFFQTTTPIERKGTTTVSGNYIAPTAFKVNDAGLIGTRKTFSCRNTGRVVFEITGGAFPYVIETYLNSSLLKTETFETYQNSGTDRNLPDFKDYYNIENLPAGNFTFKIKDGCDYGLPDISENVSYVSGNFACQNISIIPSSNINHNNIVNINFGATTTDLNKYYYDQVHRNIPWWEYTYSFDGGTEKDWKNIPSNWNIFDTVTSATKYCDFWSKNYQIQVRVKECVENACSTTNRANYSGHVVMFAGNIYDPVSSCVDEEKMRLTIGFNSGREFFTAPIYCKVTHRLSGEVLVEESINARSWNWVGIVDRDRADDTLHVKINDANGCSLIDGNYQIPPPPETEWPCYNFSPICNSASDYDYICWLWTECNNSYGKPPDGTKIELVASPNGNHYNFSATYNYSQNSWNITQDNYSNFTIVLDGNCAIYLQSKDLYSGTYRWYITDNCGRSDTMQRNYQFFRYEVEEPLTFNIQTTCTGKIYAPKVKLTRIRKGDGLSVSMPVSFRVTGVAGGFFPSAGICNTHHVTLVIPGNYQMRFYLGETDISCLIPSQPMTYAYNALTLKNAYGYACDDGINKVTKVVVTVDSTSGMPPYQFELFGLNGVPIASNTTGIFYDAGAPDATLFVRITDQCGTSIDNQRVKIANLESGASVAFAANTNICIGDDIRLLGVPLVGAQVGYHWEGPENFSSQNKDPIIHNSTLSHEGYYTLSISGLECSIIDSVYITIMPPDTGYIVDFVCRGSRYTHYGFDIDSLDTPDTTYVFYQSNLLTYRNCDSTACLLLTVRDYAFLSIEPVGEICADEPYITLPYNFYDEEKIFYNIQFNDEALMQGFQNIDSGQITHSNYFTIPMPRGFDKQDYVIPHSNYAASIFVNNGKCNSRIFEFPIQISYPGWILEQKWNDVLALLNERYNGGYTFSEYEWFKNGTKLEGKNGSYIYILPTLEFGAEYRARLTRTLDGETFFTCPLVPEYRPGMKVYPQLVTQNEPVYIETQQSGTVLVWNLLGQKITQHPIFEHQVNKIYLNKTGFFLLEVIPENLPGQTFKIIVR